MLVDRYRRDRIIGVGQVVAEKTYNIEYNPERYMHRKRDRIMDSVAFYCSDVPSPGSHMYITYTNVQYKYGVGLEM
jgi:hypothetical protein